MAGRGCSSDDFSVDDAMIRFRVLHIKAILNYFRRGDFEGLVEATNDLTNYYRIHCVREEVYFDRFHSDFLIARRLYHEGEEVEDE